MKKNLLSFVGTIALTTSLQAQEAGVTQVLDFLPAPGQYTNVLPLYEEGNTKEDMLDKCLASITSGSYVCLGGFGGYIVVGFDHTIPNVEGEYDFTVTGNAFTGSSEPGIVLVSVDANNNGIADDEWYELAGSEYNNTECKKNYTLTYNQPTETKGAIAWSNSEGEEGENAFMACYIASTNDSNYPKWIEDETISFTGTRLPDNSLATFDYGYADNQANGTDGAKLKIDWAVDANGNSVQLAGIDFVKIYSAVQQINGMFGECSTEVTNVIDLHARTATFENIELAPDSYNNGATNDFWAQYEAGTLETNDWGYSTLTTSINSGSYQFPNTISYSEWYGSYWSGVAFSNQTSTEFVDIYSYPAQEFNSAAGGAATGDNFAICNGSVEVTLADNTDAHTLSGVNITNSAYVVNSMTYGDYYAKAFEQGDYFRLTITGYNGTESTGTVEFYLADYRSTTVTDHYIVTDWTWVDLSSLGEVTSLTFTLDSSDNGDWGMNTPAYFCLDDLNSDAPAEVITDTIATFEEIAIDYDYYNNGGTEDFFAQLADGTLATNDWGYSYLERTVTSGVYSFPNTFSYSDDYGSYWSGVAFSNQTSTDFVDIYTYPEHEFNSAAGGAANGDNFAIFTNDVTVTSKIAAHTIKGVNITNSAYAVNSMTYGDDYAKAFEQGDYFRLTITGLYSTTSTTTTGFEVTETVETGTVEFYLADYRSTDASQHYIVTDWTWVDLSSLGDVTSLKFVLDSSDNNDWGYMNTPAYFCIDDFNSEKSTTSAIAPATVTTAATLSVYPSIATETIRVSLPSECSKVTIYSIQGNAVWSGQSSDSTTTINVSSLATGVYIVAVESEVGVVTTRFIKR